LVRRATRDRIASSLHIPGDLAMSYIAQGPDTIRGRWYVVATHKGRWGSIVQADMSEAEARALAAEKNLQAQRTRVQR
jgi:hypothetical protein